MSSRWQCCVRAFQYPTASRGSQHTPHGQFWWHMECSLLAALGWAGSVWRVEEALQGPQNKHSFYQHSQWWVAVVPTAWDLLKLQEEKLLCLSSSRGSGIRTESQEIPAVAVHFTSLHEAQSETCLLLSSLQAVRILLQVCTKHKGRVTWPLNTLGPDFLKEPFRESCGSQEVTGLKLS